MHAYLECRVVGIFSILSGGLRVKTEGMVVGQKRELTVCLIGLRRVESPINQ
jgi:hypothetical protein